MDLAQRIERFLAGSPHAVVGASRDREKYGNKVLRAYLQQEREVYAVNPGVDEVEGVRSYPDLASLPVPVHGASIITPPEVTERIVRDARELGIGHLWMQPGAESEAAVAAANEAGIVTIGGDACILVALRFREA